MLLVGGGKFVDVGALVDDVGGPGSVVADATVVEGHTVVAGATVTPTPVVDGPGFGGDVLVGALVGALVTAWDVVDVAKAITPPHTTSSAAAATRRPMRRP